MKNFSNIFNKTETHDSHKVYPLSAFLIKKLFFAYLITFLLISGFQLIIEFHHEKNHTKNFLNQLASKFAREISNEVFIKNDTLLQYSLNEITLFDEVSKIEILDRGGKIQFSWISRDDSGFRSAIVIKKELIQNGIYFGNLVLYSNNSLIIDKLLKTYRDNLFMNLIIFISLMVVVYLFSKKFLVKPLLNFSEELKKLSSQDIMPMVSLEEMEVDEIHSLKNTTNIFIQEIFVLKESYKILIDDLMEKYENTLKEKQFLEEQVKIKTKEILEKEYRFQSIFEQSNVAIAIADLSGNIIECNKSYEKLLEYEDDSELIGLNFSTLTHPDDVESQKLALEELFSGNAINKRMEKRYITKNKNIIWADLTFTEIKNEEDKIVNYVTIANDITKRKKYEAELEKLYNLALDANALTGLPGNNTIRKHIEDSLEKREKLCVIYADLDNFKAYNDNYGFAMGDKVIKHSANIFQYVAEELRLDCFFLGHIGGDDFVTLIPSDKVAEYVNLVTLDFESSIKSFYNDEDYARGYIQAHDRKGVMQEFPFISVSMAGLDLSKNTYYSYLEINDALSSAKKYSKNIKGNSFYMEDTDL